MVMHFTPQTLKHILSAMLFTAMHRVSVCFGLFFLSLSLFRIRIQFNFNSILSCASNKTSFFTLAQRVNECMAIVKHTW